MNEKAPENDGLDPQVREFISFLQSESAKHSMRDSLPLAEKRRIAALVRRTLASGGPAVENVRDYCVSTDSGPIRVRAMNTAPGQSKPCLVYLHGGGWTLFSLDTHDRVMREIAHRADIAVIGIDYSLSPEVRFPSQLGEIQAVFHWLAVKGADIGVDTSRIAIGGDSAGANLSLAACLKLRDEGRCDVGGLLLCYGVYNASFDTDSYHRYKDTRFNLGREEMQLYWASYLRSERDADDPLASPMKADLHGLPPTFMIIAERDVLHDENVTMAQKLAGSGVAVSSRVYPGTTHSFLEAVAMADVSGQALADAAGWLQALFRERGEGAAAVAAVSGRPGTPLAWSRIRDETSR